MIFRNSDIYSVAEPDLTGQGSWLPTRGFGLGAKSQGRPPGRPASPKKSWKLVDFVWGIDLDFLKPIAQGGIGIVYCAWGVVLFVPQVYL